MSPKPKPYKTIIYFYFNRLRSRIMENMPA
nr:MAG TPA: hypothetical protein [Caudoviricetes sp.]